MPDRDLDPSYFDAYAPAEMARRVQVVSLRKLAMPAVPTLALGILAGAFIAFGAMLYTLVMTESGLGLGPSRLLGGVAFSLGLILIMVGGAELFTGNMLIVLSWVHGQVGIGRVLRSWGLVYVANLAGALGMVALAHLSGLPGLGGGAVARTAVDIAQAKAGLPFATAFASGILCNTLVCLAVWLCFAARSVADKILAILFPITAFVALGFEHSIANMYLIPAGIAIGLDPAFAAAVGAAGAPDLAGFVANLVPVTVGNVVGGGVFVALTYYLVYLRGRD